MKKFPLSYSLWSKYYEKNQTLALFLDFDGTLAPIVKHPDLARLPSQSKKVLEALAKQKRVRVIIISGRRLSNVRRKVGIQGLIYVGNHGLEMRGPGLRYIHPEASAARKTLARVARQLQRTLRPFQGVWVENKGYTLSIHYREARRNIALKARKALRQALDIHLKKEKAVLTSGKKVWEVRPKITWNKGAAVKWLCHHFKQTDQRTAFPIYFGDDVTDESAFKILKRRGLCVKVTRQPILKSEADFYVRTPARVRGVLEAFKRKLMSHGGWNE